MASVGITKTGLITFAVGLLFGITLTYLFTFSLIRRPRMNLLAGYSSYFPGNPHSHEEMDGISGPSELLTWRDKNTAIHSGNSLTLGNFIAF